MIDCLVLGEGFADHRIQRAFARMHATLTVGLFGQLLVDVDRGNHRQVEHAGRCRLSRSANIIQLQALSNEQSDS